MDSKINNLFKDVKQKVSLIKRDIVALYFAYKDPRTPWYARLVAVLVVGYALSPIDLIPDFIPVLGYLDDLLLLPLGIYFVVKLIPRDLMNEYREKALLVGKMRKRNIVAAIIIIGIWCLLLPFIGLWIYHIVK